MRLSLEFYLSDAHLACMHKILKMLATPLVVAMLAGCAGNIVSKVEEPAYATERQAEDGLLSVRAYPAFAVAEVTVTGTRADAANAGFRPLFDYISGANTAGDKIPMTAPVRQHAAAGDTPNDRSGEKIPMTAPVRQQAASSGADGEQWVVQFVMPRGATLQSLPKPTNPAVRLHTVPAARYAVIRFAGRSTPENLGEHLTLLENWLKAQNLRPEGAPLYAFYNPPWVLPFLRRNEIWLAVPEPTQ